MQSTKGAGPFVFSSPARNRFGEQMQATAIRANRLYQEAAAGSRQRIADDASRAGSGAVSGSGPKATVRTRTMGLNLGRFGLKYTERDVEFGPDALGGPQAAERLRHQAWRAEAEVASLRADMGRADASDTGADTGATASPTPRLDALLRRRAYARAGAEPPLPRPAFSVA